MTDFHLSRLLHGASVFSDAGSALVERMREGSAVELNGVVARMHVQGGADVVTVRLTFTSDSGALVGSQGIRLSVPAMSYWHWSRGWQSLDEVEVPFGRSTALRTADGFVLELLDAVSVRRADAGIAVHRVDSALAAGTHWGPRPVIVGFRERLWDTESLSLRYYRAAFPRWQLWPIPEPARAALSITDHADFDTAEGLGQLASDPLLKNKLRLTKSVFVDNPIAARPAALSSMDTLRAVRRLADAGHEIAIHGTRPSGAGLPGVVADLAKVPLPIRTWIDHGPRSRTNTSRNGLAEGSIDDIRAALRNAGVRNLWAYLDRRSNPVGLAETPDRLPSYAGLLRRRLAQAAQAGWTRRPAHAAFLGMDGLAGPEQGWLRYQLPTLKRTLTRRGADPAFQPDPQHLFSSPTEQPERVELQPRSPLAATMHPRPVLPDWRPWFFSSIRTNDLRGLLTPEGLAAFVSDGGAEILHTYLLSNHPLAEWTGSWATSGARRGLAVLAEALDDDLWVGPLDEWTEHLRHQHNLEFMPDEVGGWRASVSGRAACTVVAEGDGSRVPIPRWRTLPS